MPKPEQIEQTKRFIIQGTSYAIAPTSYSHYQDARTIEEAMKLLNKWKSARPEIKAWRIVEEVKTITHEVILD